VVLTRNEFGVWIEERLSDPTTQFVNQNISFDFACVAATWPHLIPLIFAAYDDDRVICTIALARLLDLGHRGWISERGDYDLETLSERYLGRHVDKKHPWRLRFGELDGLPIYEYPPEALEYVVGDARAPWDLCAHLFTLAKEHRVPLDDLYRQTRAAFWLELTRAVGLYTDEVYVGQLRQWIDTERPRLRATLSAAGLIEEKLRAAPRAKYWTGRWTRKKAPKDHPLHTYWAQWPKLVKELSRVDVAGEQRAQLEEEQRRLVASLEPAGLLVRKMAREPARKEKTGEWKKNTKVAQAYAGQLVSKGYEFGRTPTGLYQLNETAADQCGDPLLQDYVLWGRLDKVEAEVVKMEGGVHAPLHFGFQALVNSGRTSGASELGLNAQNRDRSFFGSRESFIPPRGHALGSIDYDANELRTLGQACLDLVGHSELARILNEGKDPHLMFASKFSGWAYEWAVDHKKDPLVKERRQMSKAFNFGAPGKLGEIKFQLYARDQYGVGIPNSRFSVEPRAGFVPISPEHLDGTVFARGLPLAVREKAKVSRWGRAGPTYVRTDEDGKPLDPLNADGTPMERVLTKWLFETYGTLYVKEHTYAWYKAEWYQMDPAFLKYFRVVRQLLDESGGSITQLRTGRLRAGVGLPDACNTLFQGLAADGGKEAGWRLTKSMFLDHASPIWGSRIVNFVHDEFITSAPLDRLHEVLFAQTEKILEGMAQLTPDVPPTATPAAMRRWTKSAETVYDSKGQLVPWEDFRLAVGIEEDLKKNVDDEKKTAKLILERNDLEAFFQRHDLQIMGVW
jgi:hypothetical protein